MRPLLIMSPSWRLTDLIVKDAALDFVIISLHVQVWWQKPLKKLKAAQRSYEL